MITLTAEQAQQIEEALDELRYANNTDIAKTKYYKALSTIRAARAQEHSHPDDEAVDRFAAAMKAKLAKKRSEGRGGWEDKNQCTAEFLNRLLNEHVGKGDPVDVGNLAMMLWNRGERTEARAQADHIAGADKMVVPNGYALVSIDALKVWGKYDEVRNACQFPAEQAEQEPVAIHQWRKKIPADQPWHDDEYKFAYARVDDFYEARTVYAAPMQQAEQTPVATYAGRSTKHGEMFSLDKEIPAGTKLYAAPVRTKDLTVSELDAIIEKHYDDEMDLKSMILDGIAADRRKNNV